jgi:ABC-2 type transport system permease protein
MFKAIYVIVMREFKRFLRQKTRFITTFVRPLTWLFLIGGGLKVLIKEDNSISYQQFILPGILGMAILFSSIFSAISIVWDREFGFLREILVAPVSRLSIVIGKVISGTLISTLQALILLIFIPILGLNISLSKLFILLFEIIILSSSITSLGILIASFMKSFEGFNIVMNFIIMPMFFLSGAMYPVKLLPKFMQGFTVINPLTYGIDSFKNVLFNNGNGSLLNPDFSLFIDTVFIIGFGIILLILATISFRRME